MPHSSLSNIPVPQQVRLAFIDFRLLFLGSVNRPDLVFRFGISESAASRDIALYRQLAPENITYKRSSALYLPCDDFQPLYDYEPEQALTALAEGFGDDFVSTQSSWLPWELPSRLNAPSVDVLVPVSRALYGGKSLSIAYRSLSNGFSKKTITPLVLVDNGLRWHLRTFDVDRQRYADFVLNRIESAELTESTEDIACLRNQDHEWSSQIELELVPPSRIRPDSIAFEYGMAEGGISVTIRSALAGYL